MSTILYKLTVKNEDFYVNVYDYNGTNKTTIYLGGTGCGGACVSPEEWARIQEHINFELKRLGIDITKNVSMKE